MSVALHVEKPRARDLDAHDRVIRTALLAPEAIQKLEVLRDSLLDSLT